MTSILKVDTIQDTAGNNIINESGDTITIGASGDTITIPSGATISNLGTATGFGVNTPAFMVFNNGTTQSISSAAWTEITNYNTELFDSDSAFDTTTCRFTPLVAGKYFFTAQISIGSGSAAGFNGIILSKNGSVTGNSTSQLFIQTTLAIGVTDFKINGILTMNGTTDYVSVHINQQTGGTKTIGISGGTSTMFFGGYRLIGV
jgi:hypothetical protein